MKKSISVAGLSSNFPPYPLAVEAHGLLFISGLRGGRADFVPTTPEEIASRPWPDAQGFTLADQVEGEVAADAWTVHENLDRLMSERGIGQDQMLRQHIWQRDKRFFPVYESIRMIWQPVPCPSSGLGVADVSGPVGRWHGVDGIAVVPGVNPLFPARETCTPYDSKEFAAASFYSQAVRCGPLVFLAGHIPIQTDKPRRPPVLAFEDVPEEGRFLARNRSHPDSRQGPIAAQTWFCYDQIRRNLAALRLGMEDVVHVSVYLQDVRDFAMFHRVHRHFFAGRTPALCVTGFNEVGHKGTLIEIEPTVLDPAHRLARRDIGWATPAPFLGPAAVAGGPIVYLAGMVGLDASGRLIRGSGDFADGEDREFVRALEAREKSRGMAAQSHAAWLILRDTLKRAGLGLDALVKTTLYVKDLADLAIYEAVRDRFMTENLPAHEVVVIRNPGPVPDAAMQIEAIAAI